MKKLIAPLFATAALAACSGYGPGYAPAPATPAYIPAPGGYRVVQGQIFNRTDALPFGRDHVVVFVGPNCPLCDAAIQDARTTGNVRVEVLDVTTGYGAQQYAALRLRGPLPAVVANSQVMVGYDPALMRNLLGGGGFRETNPTQP